MKLLNFPIVSGTDQRGRRPRRAFSILPVLAMAAIFQGFTGLLHAQEPPRTPPPSPPPPPPAEIGTRAIGAQPAPLAPPMRTLRTPQPPPTSFSDRLQSIIRSAANPGRNTTTALIVLSSPPEAEVQASLQEDLAVMSRILEKTVDTTVVSIYGQPKPMGVEVLFAPDGGSPRHAYLDGYGALFLLKVNFPLLPPATREQPRKEEPQVSSAWEEARQELLGEPASPGVVAVTPVEPYNEERVNRLKASLVEALRNATNIRNLRASEGVTVCILGDAAPESGQVAAAGTGGGQPMLGLATAGAGTAGHPQHGAILNIRVKKTDIDAFANGQMKADEFRQKAMVTVYEADLGVSSSGRFGAGGFGYGGGISR